MDQLGQYQGEEGRCTGNFPPVGRCRKTKLKTARGVSPIWQPRKRMVVSNPPEKNAVTFGGGAPAHLHRLSRLQAERNSRRPIGCKVYEQDLDGEQNDREPIRIRETWSELRDVAREEVAYKFADVAVNHRPSSTAATKVAKLSSSRMRSLPFVTSCRRSPSKHRYPFLMAGIVDAVTRHGGRHDRAS
jgi:hypothetical protein